MPKSKGSYNIQAATASLQQRPVLKSGQVECFVHPLGREQLEYIVKKSTLALEIFDDVVRILDLDVEQDYFGLRLLRKDESNLQEQAVWLDLNRTLGDQTSGKHIQVVFAVQYFPAHPERLVDEYTRYLFFLQIRKDLFEGRLKCLPDAQTRLMAYVAQSVLGNYDSTMHKHGYVKDIPQLLPQLTEEQQNTVFLRHVELVDMTASEAEGAFVQLASQQGRYGMEVFPAEHVAAKARVLVGAGAQGVSVFHDDQTSFMPAETYRWASLGNVRFRRKYFLLTLAQQDASRKNPVVKFQLGSRREAKALWKSAVRQHTFFRQRRGVTKHEHSLLQSMLNRRTPLERSGFFGMTEIETVRNAEKSVRTNRTFSRLDETPLSTGRSRTQAFLPEDSPYRGAAAAAAGPASGFHDRSGSPTWDAIHEPFDPKDAFMRLDSFQGDNVLTETKFIDNVPSLHLSSHPSASKKQAPAPPVRMSVPVPRRATDEELDAMPPPPPPEGDLDLDLADGNSELYGRAYQPTLSPIRPLVLTNSANVPAAAAAASASVMAASTPANVTSRAANRASRGPAPLPPPRGDSKGTTSDVPQAPPSPALALAAIAAALPQKQPIAATATQFQLQPLQGKQQKARDAANGVLTETSFMAEPVLLDGQLDASLVELQPVVAEESFVSSGDRRSSITRLSGHIVSPIGTTLTSPTITSAPTLHALVEESDGPVALNAAEAFVFHADGNHAGHKYDPDLGLEPLRVEEASLDRIVPLQHATVSSSALQGRAARDIEGPVVTVGTPGSLASTAVTARREIVVPAAAIGARAAPPAPPPRTTSLLSPNGIDNSVFGSVSSAITPVPATTTTTSTTTLAAPALKATHTTNGVGATLKVEPSSLPSVSSTVSAPPVLQTTNGINGVKSIANGHAALGDTPLIAGVSTLSPVAATTTAAVLSIPPHPVLPFYARATQVESGDPQRGLIAVARHDILHITDCSDPHWWHAENTSSGRSGLVPSDATLRSRGAVASPDSKSGSNTSLTLPSEAPGYKYLTMHRTTPQDLRPVVILGPSKDHVIDRLVLDYPDVFHTCVPHTTRPRQPEEEHGLDYYFVSVEEMETSIARGEFAETLRFQAHLYGTSFAAIRAASQNGGYCVLDVSDPQTILNLENEGMFPISIFLHPTSAASVLEQNPHLSPEAAAIVVAKAAELEQTNRGLYSDIIENDKFETTYYKAYHAILAEARKPVWKVAPADPTAPTTAPQALIRMLRRSATSPETGVNGGTTSNGSSAPVSQQASQHALRALPLKLENPDTHASNAAAAVAAVTRAEAEGRSLFPEDANGDGVHTGVQLTRRRSSRKSFVGTETIRFDKLATGLGFSFTGGVDTPSAPGDPGIYVTRVAPGGAAEIDGRLQAGDKIIEANDVSFASVSHQTAQDVLRHCTAVKLKVTRKCRRIKLVADNGVFGLGIKGGADAGTPVVISRIADNSPAARHPRLALGYEITHVNDVAVRDLTHEQVLDLIRSSQEELLLIVHPRRSRSFRHTTSASARESVPPAAATEVQVHVHSPAPASSPGSPTNNDLANNPFFSAALATSQPLRATASPSPKNSPSSRARSPARDDSPGTTRAQSPPARPQSPLRPGERARSPSNKESPLVALRAGSPSPDGSPAQRARSPPRDGARASSPLRRDARSPSPSQDSPSVRARSPLRMSETVQPPIPTVLSPYGPAPTQGKARIYAPEPTAAIAAAKIANGHHPAPPPTTSTTSTTNSVPAVPAPLTLTRAINGTHLTTGAAPAGSRATVSAFGTAPAGSATSNPFVFEDEDGDAFAPTVPLRTEAPAVPARRRETVGSLSTEDNRHIRGGGKFSELLTSRPGYFRELGSKVALMPANAPRNRYKDILPYDDNRVHLQADNDYINASPVHYNGGDFQLDYIATQGPKDVTAGHFWQMVEENNVSVICMLTTLHEGGRPKCYQYWPDTVGHEQQFGQHLVHFDAEERDVSGAFVVRMFTLQSPTCLRSIHHIQFTDWPDHGVPDESEHFLSYLERAQQLKASSPQTAAPVVVHCSAGIGRTGVLIVLEVACALFERNRGVDLVELIRNIRAQRMGLVQTEGQYQFVYKILASMRRDELAAISIVTTQ